MHRLSIIIPVSDDVDGLKRRIESLTVNIRAPRPEIIVCNDGACLDISRYLTKFPFVREVVISENGGSYGARNRGVAVAIGDYYVFVDAGVIFSQTWQAAVEHEISIGSCYCGGPIQVYATNDADIYQQYEMEYSFDVEHYMRTASYAPTANVLIKREVMEKVGCFDERLRSGGDYEFGRRVFEAGYRQNYNESMRVLHDARSKPALVRKSARVLDGHQKLATLYPDRFNRVTVVKIVCKNGKEVFATVFGIRKLRHISRIHALKVLIDLTLVKIKQLLAYNGATG